MRFQIVLHEGVVPDGLRPDLAAGIRRTYCGVFGGAADAVDVDFTQIAAGHMFTAAELSRTSVVAGHVPPGTSREDRTRFLRGVTELWCEVTGCSANEIVVSASDATA